MWSPGGGGSVRTACPSRCYGLSPYNHYFPKRVKLARLDDDRGAAGLLTQIGIGRGGGWREPSAGRSEGPSAVASRRREETERGEAWGHGLGPRAAGRGTASGGCGQGVLPTGERKRNGVREKGNFLETERRRLSVR